MIRSTFFALLVVSIIYNTLGAQNERKELIIQVIKTAKDYSGIASVIDIIKSERSIYRYIPHSHPLKEQKYILSSRYGTRRHPIDKTIKNHKGIDFSSEYANRVYASADGIVVYAGVSGGYGNLIIIEHKYGFKTYYAHLTYIYSKTGDKVTTNHVIGFVGSTGASTGNHLHYEVRKDDRAIDPEPFLMQ